MLSTPRNIFKWIAHFVIVPILCYHSSPGIGLAFSGPMSVRGKSTNTLAQNSLFDSCNRTLKTSDAKQRLAKVTIFIRRMTKYCFPSIVKQLILWKKKKLSRLLLIAILFDLEQVYQSFSEISDYLMRMTILNLY